MFVSNSVLEPKPVGAKLLWVEPEPQKEMSGAGAAKRNVWSRSRGKMVPLRNTWFYPFIFNNEIFAFPFISNLRSFLTRFKNSLLHIYPDKAVMVKTGNQIRYRESGQTKWKYK